MTRDTSFLFALVMLAAAALSVGASGWLLFVRDHRASHAARSPEHRFTPEES